MKNLRLHLTLHITLWVDVKTSIRHVSDVPFGITSSVCMELGKILNTLYMFIVISSLSSENSFCESSLIHQDSAVSERCKAA
jgi:hypothetical protein